MLTPIRITRPLNTTSFKQQRTRLANLTHMISRHLHMLGRNILTTINISRHRTNVTITTTNSMIINSRTMTTHQIRQLPTLTIPNFSHKRTAITTHTHRIRPPTRTNNMKVNTNINQRIQRRKISTILRHNRRLNTNRLRSRRHILRQRRRVNITNNRKSLHSTITRPTTVLRHSINTARTPALNRRNFHRSHLHITTTNVNHLYTTQHTITATIILTKRTTRTRAP